MPTMPYDKPPLKELRTNSLPPESEIDCYEDEQTVNADVTNAENITPTNGTTPIMQKDLAEAQHYRLSYEAVSDGSTTMEALAAVASQLDPIGKTAATLPIGSAFDLGYDQVAQQNAGHTILFSNEPKNTGKNKRRQAVNPSWGSPYMFPATVGPKNLTKFHAACATGSATVLIMGDSIFNAGANLANPQQNPWETLVSAVKLANLGVDIADYNMTWGGQTWAQMASSTNAASVPPYIWGDITKSWLQRCLDLRPDLVFLYSGGNDGWGFSLLSLAKVVSAFQDIGADVILCETYQPNTGSTLGNYYQESVQDGIHFVRRYVITYAQVHGLGYLPFGRWGDMIRDGFDSEILAMPENNPVAGTAYPARYATVPPSALTNDGKDYTFPDIPNMLGVSAANCTDFCIGINHAGVATATIAWRITLSPATDNANGPRNDNALWVWFNGTNISFQITDGTGEKITYPTNHPVPRSTWSFWVMARGGRVVFAVQATDQSSSNQIEQSIGLYYTKLLDVQAVRGGGPFVPYIHGISTNGETFNITSLCSADATRADGGGLRYRPSTNALALYYNTEIPASTGQAWQPNAGGSGDYHMNNFGVRDLILPVILAQNWQPPINATLPANLSETSIAATGNSTTAAQKAIDELGALDANDHGVYMSDDAGIASIHVKGGAAKNGLRVVFHNDDGTAQTCTPIITSSDSTITTDDTLFCEKPVHLPRYAKSALPTAAEGSMVWCNDINRPVFATGGKWYPAALEAALD